MTHDPDDMDDLAAALKAATPAPDAARRAATLRLAQENFARLQETAEAARQSSETRRKGPFNGVMTMLQSLTSRGGLAATTALVACGLLIGTPAGRDLWQRSPDLFADRLEQRAEVDAAETLGDGDLIVLVPEVEEEGFGGEVVEAPAMVVQPPLATRSRPQAVPAPQQDATGGLAVTESLEAFAVESLPGHDIVAPVEADTEAFPEAETNPVKVTAEEPVSTFSIDVDTASYAVVRSSLMRGELPPAGSVRIEEMINYFPYDYPAPEADGPPIRPTVSVFETPWNADTQLVHIALQGRMPAIEDRPPLNLVFLIDTSGSMDEPAKLPLLIQSFRLMLSELRPEDEVSIVTYAGSAGQVLAPTSASERATIEAALTNLRAGGGTNGQGGLEQAYAVAEAMAAEGEVSRVILATDGDFNVGVSDPEGLTRYIEKQRESGTYLSVLGFGRGNLDDTTMQALAQNGNGQAAYIDTLSEARKVLVDQLTGALFPIAGDVKIQVEWNPAEVAEYRLIGYETRALERTDFNDDRVDAGEVGAGHAVTAIYEVTPVGSPARLSDPLRYGEPTVAGTEGELGFLRLRWKEPGADESQLLELPIDGDAGGLSEDAGFAAAIAGMGQLLSDPARLGDWGWDEAIRLATEHRGEDLYGYRGEAIGLMRLAEALE